MESKGVQPRAGSKPLLLLNRSGTNQDQGQGRKPPENREGKKNKAAELLGERQSTALGARVGKGGRPEPRGWDTETDTDKQKGRPVRGRRRDHGRNRGGLDRQRGERRRGKGMEGL